MVGKPEVIVRTNLWFQLGDRNLSLSRLGAPLDIQMQVTHHLAVDESKFPLRA